jgi:hypothetical protein
MPRGNQSGCLISAALTNGGVTRVLVPFAAPGFAPMDPAIPCSAVAPSIAVIVAFAAALDSHAIVTWQDFGARWCGRSGLAGALRATCQRLRRIQAQSPHRLASAAPPPPIPCPGFKSIPELCAHVALMASLRVSWHVRFYTSSCGSLH